MEAVYLHTTKKQSLLWKHQPLLNAVEQRCVQQSRRWLLTNYNSDDYRVHTQTSVPSAICFIDEGINASHWCRTFIWGSQSILPSGNRKWHYPNCTVTWAGLPPSLIACWRCSFASSRRYVPYLGLIHPWVLFCLTLCRILRGGIPQLCTGCTYMYVHQHTYFNNWNSLQSGCDVVCCCRICL